MSVLFSETKAFFWSTLRQCNVELDWPRPTEVKREGDLEGIRQGCKKPGRQALTVVLVPSCTVIYFACGVLPDNILHFQLGGISVEITVFKRRPAIHVPRSRRSEQTVITRDIFLENGESISFDGAHPLWQATEELANELGGASLSMAKEGMGGGIRDAGMAMGVELKQWGISYAWLSKHKHKLINILWMDGDEDDRMVGWEKGIVWMLRATLEKGNRTLLSLSSIPLHATSALDGGWWLNIHVVSNQRARLTVFLHRAGSGIGF